MKEITKLGITFNVHENILTLFDKTIPKHDSYQFIDHWNKEEIKILNIEDIKLPNMEIPSLIPEDNIEQQEDDLLSEVDHTKKRIDSFKSRTPIKPIVVYKKDGEIFLARGVHKFYSSILYGYTKIPAVIRQAKVPIDDITS